MAQEIGFKMTIDARERQLVSLFGDGGGPELEVRTLELGDVMCEYADGSSWILERKTTHDSRRTIIQIAPLVDLYLSLSLFLPSSLRVR